MTKSRVGSIYRWQRARPRVRLASPLLLNDAGALSHREVNDLEWEPQGPALQRDAA